jgi:DGQHR domain-containing protein
MTTFTYKAIQAKQSPNHQVLSFAARPADILQFAEIDRVNRSSDGTLTGFQRHQIAPHIKEIRDYLSHNNAILPNPIVVAFVDGASVREVESGLAELSIDTTKEKPGFVVDGQQRLTALSGLLDKDFEVLVSALICKDYDEMRQQFVLLNNTRPLPKGLIYELLPLTPDLPLRFTARAFAAKLVEMLNYDENSSLHGQIKQHTNPTGVISDTAIQKIVINSMADGAMRGFIDQEDCIEKSFSLLSDYFLAIQKVFPDAWTGHKPKTSRLVHGAGIVAMGYLMEFLYAKSDSATSDEFKLHLEEIYDHCHWTAGNWPFSDADSRPWNKIQNVPTDIMTLSSYLIRSYKLASSLIR